MPQKKAGLYANIQAKRKRIANGSGEKMRKPGSKGAPSDDQFEAAAKTAKPKRSKVSRHARSRRARARSGAGSRKR